MPSPSSSWLILVVITVAITLLALSVFNTLACYPINFAYFKTSQHRFFKVTRDWHAVGTRTVPPNQRLLYFCSACSAAMATSGSAIASGTDMGLGIVATPHRTLSRPRTCVLIFSYPCKCFRCMSQLLPASSCTHSLQS
jgi:hypothetical protein